MSELRELVILTADGTMAAVFRAFFERQFHYSMGCAPFAFEPAGDIFHDPLNTDGGVHRRAHEILNSFLSTYRRALVILDQQFGSELPAEKVRADIEAKLKQNGWEDRAAVVVINPELEILLWQDNPNVDRILRHRSEGSLRNYLATTGEWPQGVAKPISPKETIQRIIKFNRAGPNMVVYSEIARRVSVAGCTDPAFRQLQATLQAWFPLESA